ncbi:DUF1707 SHOCT-like domain-containing protein [Kribbella sindirgiensis]|uniref:DUF1707 and DUF2154 domain-containing protein n=1 Tax=Kribbella sindirgiensis TaxID=1124744 RepID=A0A4R0J1B0_9ACTN|nr:DUF1707 domain-containing protein [Kribbella sindirgiensis]TCC39609.1 DUF1707 and DUF2154 domain-containing protein [Kribbella sindirgiensis]
MAQDDVPQENRPQDVVPAQGGDDPALRRRVSDLEREEVADILRDAAGEGRLSYTELEDRLETLYASKTYGELVELTADLPNGPRAQSVPSTTTPQYGGALVETGPVINVFMSESKRMGGWLVPQRQEVNAVLGDVTLDYTEAQIPFDEITIDVKSILADVKIRVPQNAIVLLDSNPILGSVSEQEAGLKAVPDPNAQPTAPKRFHIRGTAILGEIKIKRGPRLSKRLGLT